MSLIANDSQDTIKVIQTVSQLLERRLLRPWTRERTPHGFDKALEEALSADETSTERIFVGEGFQCWLALFLFNIDQRSHYLGQSADADSIEAFNKLDHETRREFARNLAKIVPEASVREAIDKLLTRGSRGIKRSRLDDGVSIVPRPEPLMINHSAIAQHQAHQDYVSDPPTTRLSYAFRPYMCSAIVKKRDRAALSMVFTEPSEFAVDCLMSLAIYPNKIAYLALELFGVHVEMEAGSWHVVLENGGRLSPAPELMISGARGEALGKFFETPLTRAVQRSPAREDEVRHGILLTRCVWMTINAGTEMNAMLNLNIGMNESFEVKDGLYG